MGYIFESEIESIIRAVKIKTIGEQDTIVLKKVLSADIHSSIKAYFKSEVEKLLEEERSKEYRSKKFPYKLPEVISLQDQIDLLLIYNYQFDQNEFDSILDEAVHFEFNYLCRPQWTLLNFIMGDKRTVSTSIIEKKLRYTVDYTYFPKLIRGYTIEHGLAEIGYDELKSLLDKIDREVVARHTDYELAQMTKALFEFVESGKMVTQVEFEEQTLPINAAIVFFEDKHLDDIKNQLEYERDNNKIVQLTVNQLAEIIGKARTLKAEIKKQLSIQTEVEEVKPTDKRGEEEKKEELKEEEVAEKNENSKEVEIEIKSTTTQPADKNIISEERLGIETMEKKPKQKLLFTSEELLNLFSPKETKRIIKKLFAKNEPAFHGAMVEISLLNNWEEVGQYLDALYRANNVDPFSEEAVFFTDKLSDFFNTPNRTNQI